MARLPIRTAVALLLSATLATSCASQLSPRQELTWDAYKACQAEGPSTRLEVIKETGGWKIVGREGEVFKVGTCMREYQKKARLEGRAPAVPPALTANPGSADASGLVVPQAPAWAVGDEWTFSSVSASGRRSTFTWRVDREDIVEGVPCYVVRSGAVESFLRKSDLALSHETRNGELLRRNTPPEIQLVWPLAVGANWQQTYHYERPAANRSSDTSHAARVEAEETVTVPAGTFRTLKIVYRTKSNKTIVREEWYAPEARMWVRMYEPARSDGERTRELVSFTLMGKTAGARPE
jgi:hypothetical protein